MRATHWLGSISLAALVVVFSGCSGDDESPGEVGGVLDAGHSDGRVGITGGTRAEAGVGGGNVDSGGIGGGAGVDGSAGGAGGNAPDGSAAGEGGVDGSAAGGNAEGGAGGVSNPDAGAGAGGAGSLNDAQVDANPPSDVVASDVAPDVDVDAQPDAGPGDAQAWDGGPIADATLDLNSVGADVVIPTDAANDAASSQCRLTTGTGVCDLAVPFPTKSVTVSDATIEACPNGPDWAGDVCVGHGRLTNTWTASPSTRSLAGTVQLKAKIQAKVTMKFLGIPLSFECSLAIGGASYAQVPAKVTLPPNTPVSGFVPACSPVSAPQVTVSAGSDLFQPGGDILCDSAAALLEQNGGMSLFSDNLAVLVETALTEQVCLTR